SLCRPLSLHDALPISVPPDDEREHARRNRLAVVLLVLWVIGVSLWGFDLVMSLDPKWYSGLFGGYFVVTTLYIGFCLLSQRPLRSEEHTSELQSRVDL